MTEPPDGRQSVAVIGAGAAGLASAWLLARGRYSVYVFEARDTAGGHAHTLDLPIPGNTTGATVPVDAGFIVYNTRTYPDLVSLFEILNVEEENSFMSFAASIENPSTNTFFEWGSDTVASLFPTRSSLFNVSMYTMLFDMRRFNNAVYDFVDKLENDPQFQDANISLGEFLEKGSYSSVFIRCYLVPMVSAVWSASFSSAMRFPARSMFHFFINHGLAQVFARPQWRTPAGRSREYVTKIVNDIRDHSGVVLLGTPVTHVMRDERGVTVYAAATGPKRFDQVVFATHPPITVELLGSGATEDEKRILGAFRYSENQAYIHHDQRLMPTNKSVWSSWNFIGRKRQGQTNKENGTSATCPDDASLGQAAPNGTTQNDAIPSDDDEPVCVTYWLNKLQNYHKHHTPVPDMFLTLNPVTEIDPDKIIKSLSFGHPQFTEESVNAQALLQQVVQGQNRSWFCGAYARYGFHEDAMMIGLNVAERLSEFTNLRPWKSKERLAINDNSRQYDIPLSPLRNPVFFFIGGLIVLNAVMSRLQQGLGKIAARMSEEDPVVVVAVGDGRLHRFGPRRSRMGLSRPQPSRIVNMPGSVLPGKLQSGRMTVRTPKVLARITEALRYRHPLAPTAARAFAAAEVDCPTPQDLSTTLKALFIADGLDVDPSKARAGRAKFAESLLSYVVGGFQKVKTLPTHTRLTELTTCISSVVYPSWWLEMDSEVQSTECKQMDNRTVSLGSISDLNAPSNTVEILGDLSEATISILQSNDNSRATVVVRTSERMTFVDRKAELLSVREQIEIVLFKDFVKQWSEAKDERNTSSENRKLCFDLILSPALVNLFEGSGFKTLGETYAFVRQLAVLGATIEFGVTVCGVHRDCKDCEGPRNVDDVFAGDEGFTLCRTRDVIGASERCGLELQRVSFMDNEEAALDVQEVINRVYNSLAVDLLEPSETRVVLAQLCLWEAALLIGHVRRMAVRFRAVRILT